MALTFTPSPPLYYGAPLSPLYMVAPPPPSIMSLLVSSFYFPVMVEGRYSSQVPLEIYFSFSP